MSIDHTDLVALSEEMCAGAGEPHWRGAISRAYYGAYHGCQDWHSKLPAPGSANGPGGGVHQQFINQLQNPAPELKNLEVRLLSKKLSAFLNLMKIQRHRADYALGETIDAALAANMTARAKQIISLV